MAKTSKVSKSAPASKLNVIELEKGWEVTKKDGKEEYTVTKKFVDQVIEGAGNIGKIAKAFEDQQVELSMFALNLASSYAEWKRVTGNKSLPMWVSKFFDSTVPEKYGDPGSEIRAKVNGSFVFRGIESLMKRAGKLNKIAATTKELKAAKIDPNNADEVKKYNKELREKTELTRGKDFAECMVAFHTDGVNQATMFDLLDLMGKVTKKGKLSPAGDKLMDAAKTALLAEATKKSA